MRDHPELFVPFPRRRASSSQSLSSMSSNSTHKEDTEDGQLRYWTSSMCSSSPHLFDFVVTVSLLSLCYPLCLKSLLAWWRRNSIVYIMALPTHCSSSPSFRSRLPGLPHELRFCRSSGSHGLRNRQRHSGQSENALHMYRLPIRCKRKGQRT